VTLIWPDNTIRNTWLRLTVLATPRTGLSAPDVFYFGSLLGDTGDSATSFRVNALDLGGIKRALNGGSTITGRFDFNRDGRVNALDLAIVKQGLNRTLAAFTAPAAPAPASPFFSAPAPSPARRVWDELPAEPLA
jgi:hypothetical protein